MTRYRFLSVLFAMCVTVSLSPWGGHRLDAGDQDHSPPSGSPLPDFSRLLIDGDRSLAGLSSTQDMGKVFLSQVAPQFGLNDVSLILRSGERAIPPVTGLSYGDLQDSAIRLVGELNRWRLASGIREAEAGHQNPLQEPLTTLLDQLRKQASFDKTGQSRGNTARLTALADAVVGGTALPQPSDQPALYETYRTAVEQRYPLVENGRMAWLPLFEEKGAEALRTRLLDGNLEQSIAEDVRAQLARRYFDDRLLPYLRMQLAKEAATVEHEASLAVVQEWAWMKGFRDKLRETVGLKRLCGTWQWVVHNHRNHSDTKTIVTFNPTAPDRSGVANPAEVVVLGDSVYLRWEFGGSQQQEDSLLFVGEGQRLEGSFVNTSGSWGSITGKRLKACKPEPNR